MRVEHNLQRFTRAACSQEHTPKHELNCHRRTIALDSAGLPPSASPCHTLAFHKGMRTGGPPLRGPRRDHEREEREKQRQSRAACERMCRTGEDGQVVMWSELEV
jgi:hypothetical protein